MLIRIGLIGPKVRPTGVTDGLQVKIPVLDYSDKFQSNLLWRNRQGWTKWEKQSPQQSFRKKSLGG
jgi:hypothetical protein